MKNIKDTLHADGFRWTWFGMSQNPNITIDFVLEYINAPWDWHCLSKNPGITQQDIETYIDDTRCKWYFFHVSKNPTATGASFVR